MQTKNPTILSTAAILLIVASLLNMLAPIVSASDLAPAPIVVASVAIGVLGLITVFGLFTHKGWGLILAFLIAALWLWVVLGVGGLMETALPLMKVLCVALVVLGVVIIALMTLPSGRQLSTAR